MFLVLLLRLKPDEHPVSRHPEEAVLTNDHESAHCWCLPPAWVAHQSPLSMQFSRQEYWSGVHGPPPGVLPNPGMELTFLRSPTLAGRFFPTSATCKAHIPYVSIFCRVFILNACRLCFCILKKWHRGMQERPL